jgi:hypothetical protein
MGIPTYPIPYSHCVTLTNAILSVLGYVSHIAPWTLRVNFTPSLAQYSPLGQLGEGQPLWNQNFKNKKSNVGINVLDESIA